MFLFLSLLPIFHFVKSESGISTVRYDVPFEYLVSRTPIYSANVDDQFNLRDLIIGNCGKHMCFAAFYDYKTKFELIIDVTNNCTKHPNCLSFTADNYHSSIVFMNSSDNTCSRNVTALLKEKFKMLECPKEWYSWTRPNGKLWCFMISTNSLSTVQTWNSTNSFCGNNFNASLNGFQTTEERKYFVETIKSLDVSNNWMHLGAVKPCASKSCPKTVKFAWQNEVSTNDTIANDNFYDPYFDASGNCLAIMTQNGQYDDISCHQEAAFSCGKWADIQT